MSQQIFSLALAFLKQNFIAVLIAGTLLLVVLTWTASSWKTAVDKDRNTFNDFIKEMRRKIDDILLRLPLPKTLEANSPITLSDLGKKVADEIHVDNWVDEYVEEVRARIGDGPTPYSIQDACFQYTENELMRKLAENGPPERKENIEMSAYQNGIEVPSILRVVGVKLRDKILRDLDMEAP